VARYSGRGILARVDGIGPVGDVTDRVLGSIGDMLGVPVNGQ